MMFEFLSGQFAVLEFASWSMLGWLAAGLLPWLIHRWFRQHHHKTAWAAVELLLAAVQQNARRIRVQQLLLLALRTAILLLVTCAAAEPVWRQWAWGATGSSQVHRILVVDQSYSMGCAQDGDSRLQRALLEARQLIETADSVSVLGWGAQVENLIGRPSRDRSVANSVLQSLEVVPAEASVQSAMNGITNALERAEEELPGIVRHEVFFLTDLGRNTWELDEKTQTKLESLSERAKFFLIDVGEGERENLAITNVEVDPPLVLRDREHTIAITLQNFGLTDRSSVPVQIEIDGRVVLSESVDIDSTATETISMSHRFIDEGWCTIQATLADDRDSLSIDNRRWTVFQVRPRIRVACLSSVPGELKEVARALSYAQGEIVPEEFSLNRLPRLDLSQYEAVCLSGNLQLSERETKQLENYVQGGGALVVSLSRVQLPLPFLPVSIAPDLVEGQFHLDPLEYGHPIVRPFRGREKAGLLGVLVSRYVKMMAEQQAEVVLSFDTGDPALVLSRHGLGSVAVLAMPASLSQELVPPWSTFPVNPSFVPVMRELLTYTLIQRWSDHSRLFPGQAIRHSLGGQEVVEQLQLQLPSGDSVELSPRVDKGPLPVVFAETDQLGVYFLRTKDREVARFAVNLENDLSPYESNLASIGMEFFPDGIVGAAGSSPMQWAGAELPLSRGLLQLAAVLLFCELTLAWFLGRGWT